MTHVIGIGSWDRSGSTILARALGSCRRVISVGEINNLWERGVISDLLCGCGRPFSGCPFWTDVMSRAFSDDEGAQLLGEAIAFSYEASNQRLLRMRMTGQPDSSFERYVIALERLYRAILDVGNADVLVDSSKIPWHLAAATKAASRFNLIHLVRDPRGVVYSHRKVVSYEPEQNDRLMERKGVGFTTAGWIYRNLIFSLLWRSPDDRMVVSYEQFTQHPDSVLAAILEFVGRPAETVSPIANASLDAITEHSVSGNPVRFDTDPIAIRLDDEWQSRLGRGASFTVGTATAPLRMAYERRATTTLSKSSSIP